MLELKICYVATTIHVSKALKEGLGGTTHTFNIAREFVRQGHEVHLVSEKYEGDKDYEKISGIHVHRLLRGVISSSKKVKANPLRKFLRPLKKISNLYLGYKISEVANKYECDVIFERAQSLGTGAIASKITGKPFYIEVVDDCFSRFAVNQAKKIFSFTKTFFNEKNKKKVKIVETGVDTKLFRPIKTKTKYDLCYCGSFKTVDGVEDIVEAVKILRDTKNKKVKVLLIGKGERFEEINDMIKEYGLEKQFYLTGLKGYVSTASLPKHMCSAKVCVAPFNVKRAVRGNYEKYGFYASPLKVLEYISCGQPVIATNYALIKRMLGDRGNAVFRSNSVKDLVDKISLMLKKKNLAAIGNKNRKASLKYEWSELTKTFAKEFKVKR